MYTTGASVTSGCSLLVHLAVLYFLVSIPLRYFLQSPITPLGEKLNTIADRILVFDVIMSIFDLVIEDGKLRPPRIIKQLMHQEWNFFTMHLLAISDVAFRSAATPVTMSATFGSSVVNFPVLRILRLPHLFNNLLTAHDLSLASFRAAGIQLMAILFADGFARIPFLKALFHDYLTGDLLVAVGMVALGVYCAVSNANRTESAIERMTKKPDDKSDPLAIDSLDEICEVMIKKSRLLKTALAEHDDFLNVIIGKLKHETFPPSSTLATIGEIGRHMFFLARGSVQGKTAAGKAFQLHAGESFGEIALFCPMSRRTATLTALKTCEVFLLHQDAFDNLRATYPALAKSVRQEVANYLKCDSALYVSACVRQALECCFVIGFLFISVVYILVRSVRRKESREAEQ
eukprot:m.41930 g.41930  ORF g.41930 m.41930 type:complete len:404 (-) comp16932_c0_seq1:66-1277(-)